MTTLNRANTSAMVAILGAHEDRTIEALGDQLAEENKYPLQGLEAIHYHLIQKHNWLPRDVRSMSIADIKLACASELESLVLTDELVALRSVLTSVATNIPLED
jgi:hypothetical protein